MRVFQVVSAAILSAVMVGGPVGAQTLSQVSGPRELPPAGYSGNQYVDSAGCVFIRAGVGGQTTWVPRVSRDRKLVCGYDPTFPPGMPVAAEATKAPAPVEAAPVEAAEAPATAAAAVVAEPTISGTPAPKAAPMSAPMSATAATARAVPAPAAPPHAQGGAVRLVHATSVDRAATLCLSRAQGAQRYLLSDGRRVTQCAAGISGEPVAYLNGLGAPGLVVEKGAPSATETRRALAASQGSYRVTWSNGPIAGLPKTAVKPAATLPAGAGGYVQVGVFAEPPNAQAAIARLKALGLPVASATGRKDGRAVKAIMAGPFVSAADLNAALVAARSAGYRDAYIRG